MLRCANAKISPLRCFFVAYRSKATTSWAPKTSSSRDGDHFLNPITCGDIVWDSLTNSAFQNFSNRRCAHTIVAYDTAPNDRSSLPGTPTRDIRLPRYCTVCYKARPLSFWDG
ncbi:hypothetical protein GCM10023354_05450 [Garicola koreensis]